MANKQFIQTPDAPAAIGTYSQAIRAGDTVYLSGQIGLDPATMQMVEGIDEQIHRVFQNLRAVAIAANSNLDGIVKLNVYLTDLKNFAKVNEIMAEYFNPPYPRARRRRSCRFATRRSGGNGWRAGCSGVNFLKPVSADTGFPYCSAASAAA